MDNADRYASAEALIASASPLPTHQKKGIDVKKNKTEYVLFTCFGSGQTPKKVYVEKVSDSTKMPTVVGLCQGNCGKKFVWRHAYRSWKIR